MATNAKTRATSAAAPAKKDLHDGTSLWATSSVPKIKARRARTVEQCDIAVIGGGISGALTALALAESGFDVMVVDRREPGRGSTVASTAMIQFEIDTPLVELGKKIGSERASRAWQRSARAVRDLGQLLSRHNIDADWVDRDALYLAGSELGHRALQIETDARQGLALPSTYLTKSEVADRFGFEATGAILSAGSAELDPAKASAGCLAKAVALGATVLSPCEITQVKSSDTSVALATSDGHAIHCDKVVFATGYEVIRGLPRDAFDIVSSWAIATKPIDPSTFWTNRSLIWEAADPYLYMRATADNRILAGGEDSKLTDPVRRAAAIGNKSEKLLRKVSKLLGRDDLEIDYAWAGAFADSPTGLPIFREVDGLPSVFAILGCGGNGITFSVIAADVVTAWARGKSDPDADLFCGL